MKPQAMPLRTKTSRLISLALLLLAATSAQAQKKASLAQVEFGADFFNGGGRAVDVTRFGKGNPLPAGVYRVDLYVNDGWIGRQDVTFRNVDDSDYPVPCFSRSLIEVMGVDLDKLTDEARQALTSPGNDSCLRLEELVQDAVVEFDSGDLRLNISVPQVSLLRTARGYVSPKLWDNGVNAAMTSYNFNAYSSSSGGQTNTSYFLNLNSGVNLGAWRFRNNSSVTRQATGPTRVQTIASYAQRSISAVDGLLTLGDAATSGQLFDSIAFRGVQLASDARMLPDSQNGYAPVIRGVARTNAKVQIRQNGNIIYETTVAPGRFEINDLYPTGFGGNLRVLVTEADGSTSSFDVPYASVAQMLRPGTYRYSLTAGRTRSAFQMPSENFVQATYEYGLNNVLTLSGGALLAKDYLSLVGGGAVSTPLGAFGANLTGSQARLGATEMRGQSWKFDYNKNVIETGTNFALAAFRYSSSGYLRLQDLQALKVAQTGRFGQVDRPRSQLQLTMSQSLGERGGSLYLVGASQNYWNRDGVNTTFSLGYSNNWRSLSYNVSAQRTRQLFSGATNTVYQFTVAMPLGREVNSPSMSSSISRDQRNGSSMQTALFGTAGEERNLTYSISANRSPGSSGGSANAQYRAPVANLGASYGYTSGGSRQMSATVSGGVVVHAGGVLLAQNLGDTIAIVQAQGAGGAAVSNTGTRLNDAGYAVVPYMTPFRNNEVVLDPKGTSTDVEMKSTSQRVAPVAGAVVLMKYETVSGRSVMINAYKSDGEAVPFAADVLDEQGNALGMVGQGGVVFVRTQADSGVLTLRWAAGANGQCRIRYALGPREKNGQTSFQQLSATCEAVPEMAAKSVAPTTAQRPVVATGG